MACLVTRHNALPRRESSVALTEPNFLFPFPESVFCKDRDGRWKEGRRAGRGLELRYVRFEVAVSCVFKPVALCTKHLFSTFENMLREHSLDSLVALGESFFRTYLENSPSLTISHTVRNPRKLGELREPVALDQQSGLSVFSLQKYFPPPLFPKLPQTATGQALSDLRTTRRRKHSSSRENFHFLPTLE